MAKTRKAKTQILEILPKEVGRPPIYDKDYHPAKAVELLKSGVTKTAVAACFDISRETIYEWERTHREFKDALGIGKAKQIAAWEDALAKITLGQLPKGNVTGCLAQLRKIDEEWQESSRNSQAPANSVNIGNMNVLNQLKTSEELLEFNKDLTEKLIKLGAYVPAIGKPQDK